MFTVSLPAGHFVSRGNWHIEAGNVCPGSVEELFEIGSDEFYKWLENYLLEVDDLENM